MSQFNYAATAATATRLLQRFGASATLKRQTTGAYDPSTGTTPVTVTELATTAAVFAYDQKYIDGTLILQGDQRAYLVPAQVPKQGDVLAWNGKDWRVVAVKPIAPAGTVVLYEAQLRGQ
ncbi:hypothetical protein [Pseudoxanthomonas sp. PXM05]|uniref:hypothetical protein n=1 Tax=Pseudoxanthomonas sp. PXM05 TaxID=2854775 RepID=UPI001C4954E4|nr:hypothetical protein [Pseudoxanthomonas sp. PXM05]MBV7475394.1 hypothetical protein [Pseudoxanthomonas sp. PXM05]